MNNYILIFLSIFLSACYQNEQKIQQEQVLVSCNCKDLITVYANTHLLPRDVQSSYANEDKEEVVKTQRWLYETISENLVLAEGIPYSGRRFNLDSLLNRTGYPKTEIEKLTSYAQNYEVSFRYIIEGQKEVYGMENDSLSNLQRDIAKKYYSSGTLPETFYQLNDERSKVSADYAQKICVLHCQPVAIIVGELHLEWFRKNGYKVAYPPRNL